MPDSPTLSLCLATYNRARYLDRYLTHHLGALDASGLDYELVVSDNCSTDETPEILARYAAQNPRMRVSRQVRNLGAYPNILTTLHQARGEVVVSIADDDLAIPDQLVAYARQFNPGAFPDASAVGNSILAFTCERMTVAAKLQAHARNWANTYELLRRLHAYDFTPNVGVDHNDVALLAGIETAFVECGQLGADRILVDEAIPDQALSRIRPLDGVVIARPADISALDARRAYCQLGKAANASIRPQDFSCDLEQVMARFPIFPASS